MKERPILFSGPMVSAVLAGRKTATRRVVKPQPIVVGAEFPSDASWWVWNTTHGRKYVSADSVHDRWPEALLPFCPYGQPGDRLWVRETAWYDRNLIPSVGVWRCFFEGGDVKFANGRTAEKAPGHPDAHCADVFNLNDSLVRRPSIHMPRWASRLTLEITEVRVQRLQEISKADCEAEGLRASVGHQQLVQARGGEVLGRSDNHDGYTASMQFIDLWDSLNAKRGFGWDKNPYVWAISFKRLSSGNQGGS